MLSKPGTRKPVLSESDLEQMEEEATEVLSNLSKVRESWSADIKASGLSPSADSDKKAFREFKTNQTVLTDESAIRHELEGAMNQVRQHNDACLSKSTSDAVERLILRFADATGLNHLTAQVPINGGTTKYTYWQDSSTRSRYRLFSDPGSFWPRKTYDKRNRSHEPDMLFKMN